MKNHYTILNETGFTIEFKQCGSPDPGIRAVRPNFGQFWSSKGWQLLMQI